jgi:excisionase family DNA binding protein
MSAVSGGTRDPSPHARIIMFSSLVRSCFPVSPCASARPVRPSGGPRRPAAGDRACSPWAVRVARPCAPSGPDSGNTAIAAPRGHGLDLDMAGGVGAGSHQSRAAGQPALPPGPYAGRDPGGKQRGADDRRPGSPPSGPRHHRPASSRSSLVRAGRPEAAVTGTGGRAELDRAAGGERASVRHRAARHAAPIGGSNRLLSVDELAAYLGVPKKTVYGCWRQWGLRGYRVGRYLRFRERHVEQWLQTREV